MTENQKEKPTPLKNVEEQEKLKVKYEEDNKKKSEIITELENKITKKNDEIFEKDKQIEKLTEEKDDWKTEAHSARKIQSETKAYKEQNDFLTEFKKLQEKKGLQWDETQQTWITIK